MSTVTSDELLRACDELWDTDENRFVLGKELIVHLAGQKYSTNDKSDKCDSPFFINVDGEKLNSVRTFRAFVNLLDNYVPVCGQAENVTATEKKEEIEFIEAVCQSRPMKYCFEFLKKKNRCPSSAQEYKKFLHQLWFGLYRRTPGGPLDSSGFEHVFVGEIKNGEVSGCHNWIQIYLEEKKGHINYKGFFAGRSRRGEKPAPYVVTLQFDWLGVEKKIGSTLIGTSPEFEMALFTMCFLCRDCAVDGKSVVELGDFRLNVVTFDYAHGKHIGTAFPEAM